MGRQLIEPQTPGYPNPDYFLGALASDPSSPPLNSWWINYTTSQVKGYVVNGLIAQVVVFDDANYCAVFTQSGLPTGSPWSVTLAGVGTQTSTGSTIVFSGLANGTYGFTIPVFGVYVASPASGSVTIASGVATQAVAFAVGYNVTFVPSGLTSAQTYDVVFNGVDGGAVPGDQDTVFPLIVSGTYSWTITPPAGYTCSPNGGSITVSGGDFSQPLAFSVVTNPTLSASTNVVTAVGANQLTSFPIAVADGDDVYLQVCLDTAATPMMGFTITDSESGSYGAPIYNNYDTNTHQRTYLYHRTAPVTASGSFTVEVSCGIGGAPTANWGFAVYDVANSGGVDVVSAGANGGGSIATDSVTTTQPNDLVLTFYGAAMQDVDGLSSLNLSQVFAAGSAINLTSEGNRATSWVGPTAAPYAPTATFGGFSVLAWTVVSVAILYAP